MASNKIFVSFWKVYLVLFLVAQLPLFIVLCFALSDQFPAIGIILTIVIFELAVPIHAAGACKYSASTFSHAGATGYFIPDFTPATLAWSELAYQPTSSLISPFFVFRAGMQKYFLVPKPIVTKFPELYRKALAESLPHNLSKELGIEDRIISNA